MTILLVALLLYAVKETPSPRPLALRWQALLDRTLDLAPAADGERIYVPVAGGTLVALGAQDGKLRWRAELGGEIGAAPVADGRAVYLASDKGGGGFLRALSAATGIVLWQTTLAQAARHVLISQDRLYVIAADGTVAALERSSGRTLWRFDARACAPPLLAFDRLYVGTASGDILALDPLGRIVARWRAASPPQRLALDAKGTLYCATTDGRLLAFTQGGGAPRWTARAGAAVLALAASDDLCLAASLDNFVRAYTRAGARLWKRQLAGRVVATPLVENGVAVVTPLTGDLTFVLDMRTGRTLAFLPVPEPTGAPPLRANDLILFTTRSGLLAFGPARP